jgi:hypothetical protein
MYLIFECSNTFMLATVQHSIVTVMQKLTMIGSSPFSSLRRIQTDPGDRDIFAVHPLFRCQFRFVTGSVRVQVGVEIPGEKKLRLCSSTTQPRTHTTCCSCQAEGANIKLNLS